MGSSHSSDLYVGYLPVPGAVRRFLVLAVPAVFVGIVMAALAAAWTQRDPGSGVWDVSRPRKFEGVLIALPYPMVYADDRGDGAPGMVMLVEGGKHGAGGRAAEYDGRRVTVTGFVLTRSGMSMLELEPGESAIQASKVDGGLAVVPMPRALGPITIRGEIVDAKCYLGAMKPGTGRTHKECATLCVLGGIPPMLVSRSDQDEACYLIVNEDRQPLDPAATTYIADPVEVSGELEEVGDLRRVRVRVDDIRRISGR